MSNADVNSYDAIIIGAGIGGLVCGCYLAKAGMKVLIAEQHHNWGGYCTSFKRRDFIFDAGPHCFGSYRTGGMTRRIFEDLGVDRTLNIIRSDPSDIIITPHHSISFWNDFERTVGSLQALFPAESSGIRSFFSLLLDTNPKSFSLLRRTTFKTILDLHFTSDTLKTILGYPLLAVNGLPPSLMSAFVGAKLYSEFIFDGGYYPVGGMHKLADAVAERYKSYGGEVRLSTHVESIKTDNNRVIGIILDNGDFIPSYRVISNVDARQTFLHLLGADKVEADFSRTLMSMVPSLSNFILYLGIDKDFRLSPNPGTAVHFFSHYDIEKAYQAVTEGDFVGYGGYAFRVAHDYSTIYAGMPAPFKSKIYWAQHKQRIMESFIERLEKNSMPDLRKHIVFKDAASPYTMYRYTSNYQGAAYGWAGIPTQLIVPGFRKPSFIQGLYLVGHWTTLGVGVSGAAYVGYDTARTIAGKKNVAKRRNI